MMDFQEPSTWPASVLSVLHRDEEVLADWFLDRPAKSAEAFDRAHGRLDAVLAEQHVLGFHCTRLTEQEIGSLLSDGMKMPDAAMLTARIKQLVSDGELDDDMASQLLARHQANDPNRRGRVWFSTYPPHDAGEGGIGRFFRHWGGEALYNAHERDSGTSPVLRAIGIPCVVEAVLPIANLELGFAPMRLMGRYLASVGYQGIEQNNSDVQLLAPLEAGHLVDVHRSPGGAFQRLTRLTL
jgi:hypothetical protein